MGYFVMGVTGLAYCSDCLFLAKAPGKVKIIYISGKEFPAERHKGRLQRRCGEN